MISSAELVILKPHLGRFLIKADLFSDRVFPVRYSETRHVEVAKRTFRWCDNEAVDKVPPLFSIALLRKIWMRFQL